uniref:hypothetical protein n=2 Tax=Campylobacter mucosalis TaxID=202 RepID=UPI00147025AD
NSTQNITSVNDEIDKLLQKLNQYAPLKFVKFSNQDISDMIMTYSNTIKKSLNEINFLETKNNIEQIKQYKQELLENEDNIKNQIAQIKDDIDDKHAEISNIYNELDKENNQSIYNKILYTQQKIENVLENIKVSNDEATEKLTKITEINEKIDNKLKELDKFHTKIFGQKVTNKEGEEVFKNGIDEIVDKNLQSMKNLYVEFKDKFDELYHIGTNASLASSYNKERKSFFFGQKCYGMLWQLYVLFLCSA